MEDGRMPKNNGPGRHNDIGDRNAKGASALLRRVARHTAGLCVRVPCRVVVVVVAVVVVVVVAVV